MAFLELVKRLPIDLGQGSYRHKTKAKQMAYHLVPRGNNGKALDLGCGDGYWSRQISKKNWKVTSADNFDFRNPATVKLNAEDIFPFEDNTFDLVWSSEVIEHIQNVEQFISEIRRVTKPKGTIILTTPNSAFWLYKVLSIGNITAKQIQNPDHKQFFSYDDIRNYFPSADVLGFFPYAVIKIPIRNAIGPLSPTFVIRERVNK